MEYLTIPIKAGLRKLITDYPRYVNTILLNNQMLAYSWCIFTQVRFSTEKTELKGRNTEMPQTIESHPSTL